MSDRPTATDPEAVARRMLAAERAGDVAARRAAFREAALLPKPDFEHVLARVAAAKGGPAGESPPEGQA